MRESVFVTGGAGFVGRQLVERLTEHGYRVRALVRRAPEKAFDPHVEMVIGDLNEPATYATRLANVAAVVHAALTDDFSQEPRATTMLRDLSAESGVRKFIHLSSIAVYGSPAEGTITEETPLLPGLDPYARIKAAIEVALRANSAIAETVILRLACVYGPGGGWWSGGLLDLMSRGNLIMINDGEGIANLIHVADVVSLISLLLARSNAPFEIFNVTDGRPITWRRYFLALEKMVGRKATLAMSAEQARRYGRKWLRPSILRRAIRNLSGDRIIYPLDDQAIESFASRAVYSSERLSTTLSFQASYDLQAGLATIRAARGARSMRSWAFHADGGELRGRVRAKV
jgi:nucleoside-diphosphate-sugar epimerase